MQGCQIDEETREFDIDRKAIHGTYNERRNNYKNKAMTGIIIMGIMETWLDK